MLMTCVGIDLVVRLAQKASILSRVRISIIKTIARRPRFSHSYRNGRQTRLMPHPDTS